MHLQKSGHWLEMRITKKQEGLSVMALLQNHLHLPNAHAAELLQADGVMLNKEPAQSDLTVKSGDRLRCLLFPEEPYGVLPAHLPLDVLYEDDHLLIVNKAAEMKVHANEAEETDTLLNAIAFHYQMQGLQTKVRVSHRLDQDTSGAILFPKHALMQKLLDAKLAEHTIIREYWAVLQGVVSGKKGTIDAPIGRDRYHATRRRVSKTGKHAVTDYTVLAKSNHATLVKVTLQTGRTHQIRVHFAHLGHPLLGDELYGGAVSEIERQALHARYLRFLHPLTEESLEIEAPLPDDFANLLTRLQLTSSNT